MWMTRQTKETIEKQLEKDGHLLIRQPDDHIDQTEDTITKVKPKYTVHAIKDGYYDHMTLDLMTLEDSLDLIHTANNTPHRENGIKAYTEVWIDD